MKLAALWIGKILLAGLILVLAAALAWAAKYFCKNFLKKILKVPRGAIAFFVLLLFYLGAAFADFLAPYEASTPRLSTPFHPPAKLFFKGGRLHAQIYENVDPSASKYIPVEGQSVPIKFFPQKKGAKLLGLIPINRALFGADSPDGNARIYLLGSDSTGRDVFSRMLYGAKISLSIGFIGIAITMVIGFIVGGLSGYFGGAFDFVCMRFVEFLMSVPSLYLLLAMRSALAPHFTSSQMYVMIVIILSAIGWAGAARVLRGMSLSLAKRQFVQAAQAMGENPLKIILRHFLPNVLGFLIVSATLSIPSYILGEAALSFLGLGIQEPSASWGLMLSQAQNDTKILMLGFWWLLAPGLAIFITVLAFNVLGDLMLNIANPKNIEKR
ncbi:MAG: ABC transporter permease [Opitutales bacterium]|nr:ABC transporter permease [Opitutales bacterium]